VGLALVQLVLQVMASERCGDHLVTNYRARVNAMKLQFFCGQQPELGEG
jgi:hypothetical protein